MGTKIAWFIVAFLVTCFILVDVKDPPGRYEPVPQGKDGRIITGKIKREAPASIWETAKRAYNAQTPELYKEEKASVKKIPDPGSRSKKQPVEKPAKPLSLGGDTCARVVAAGRGSERMAKVLQDFGHIFEKHAKRHGVDCRLVAAIAAVESGGYHHGDPLSAVFARSNAKEPALGIMQMKPSTGRKYDCDASCLWHPERAVAAGLAHLAELIEAEGGAAHAVYAYYLGQPDARAHRGFSHPQGREYLALVRANARLLGLSL